MRRPELPPTRCRGPRAVLLALAFACLAAGPSRSAPPPQAICDDLRPAPAAAGGVRAAALSESLFMATRVPEMEQVLGAALAAARARGDRAATLWFLRRAGELRARHGRVAEAMPALREAETLALALGDSLTLASAVRWQAAVLGQQGDFAALRRMGERLRTIAEATGDRVHQGWADAVAAWADVQDGRLPAAIAHYRRAAVTFRALGDAKDEIFVLNGLAIAQRGAGQFDAARASFLRTIALTESTIYRRVYGHALLNLAHLEHDLGDPAAATEYYGRVYTLFRSRLAFNELADPLIGLAAAHAELGQYAAANAALDSVHAVAIAFGFRDELGTERVARARIAAAAGRLREAMRLLDQAAAMGDSLNVDGRISIALIRADALDRLGRRSEAGLVLAKARRSLGTQVDFGRRVDLDLRLVARSLEAGDARGSRDRARALATESSRAGMREPAMGAWLVAARAERALGNPASALAALDSARAEWEALRGRPSVPEWRERRGALARDLTVETVDLLLAAGPGGEPDRTRAAFDALQRFKARTLLERVAGPRGGGATAAALTPATLAGVRIGLRDGELLLDYLVGAHLAFVFAVTRDGARAAAIPDAAGLEARAALYRDLLASRGPGDARAANDARLFASRRLGSDLLGPALRELAEARQLMVSPDGALHLVPFATLEVVDSGDRPGPLLERVAVSTVPSASLLLAVRAGARTGAPGPMLAVADSLPGARSEARAIGGDLAGARFVSVAGDRALAAADLEQCGAIHFAGHSEADDASPWRSVVPFLHVEGGRVANAADIAALRLPARLAVLSSCQTVGGAVLSGEGVTGLSSAFLAAGVPTVVASLWRVDDRVTQRLMAAFYRALLEGADPARALQAAQRAIRNQPATGHPFYWAGFVVVGDGAALPGLRANPFSTLRLSGYAAAILALAAMAVLAQRFRKRKTVPPPV